MVKFFGRLAAALAATVALASCAGAPPSVQVPEATPGGDPVLDTERVGEILARIGKDTAPQAKERTGPALEQYTAQTKLAAASAGKVTPVQVGAGSTYVAKTDSFPRVAMVVTKPPAPSVPPQLLVLQQAKARENYLLWGQVDLFPGAVLPSMPVLAQGSEPVGENTGGLVMSPDSAVKEYVKALNNITSPSEALFHADAFKNTYRAQLAAETEAVKAAGTSKRHAVIGKGPYPALASADGGALVVAPINYTITMNKTVEGATLNISGAVAALAGSTSVAKSMVATAQTTLVFYIPPQGSKDTKIRVLGASPVLLKAALGG